MADKVEQVSNGAQAIAMGLIAGDAKITMAGKEPKEAKEQAANFLNGAMPTAKGVVEALSKDPHGFEKEDAGVLAVRAVALTAFGTHIGSAVKK